MSALGYYDIIKELGKNIIIYPLKNAEIKGSSVDLSASKFAWSLRTKKSIVDGGNIALQPNDTSIIVTNEVIYTSKKICGTYHSKVSLTLKGLSHISTTLDPLFMGVSVILIHNNTDDIINISVDSHIVSIMFYYVKTPSETTPKFPNEKFVDLLENYDNISEFKMWLNQKECGSEIDLRDKMLSDADYANEKRKLKYKSKLSTFFRSPIFTPVITIALLFILFIVLIVMDSGNNSINMGISVLIPLAVYCMLEIFKHFNKYK